MARKQKRRPYFPRRRPTRKFHLEPLEPRLLLSADLSVIDDGGLQDYLHNVQTQLDESVFSSKVPLVGDQLAERQSGKIADQIAQALADFQVVPSNGTTATTDDVKAALTRSLADLIKDGVIRVFANADNSEVRFQLTLADTESDHVDLDLILGSEDPLIEPLLGITNEVEVSFDWEFDLSFGVSEDAGTSASRLFVDTSLANELTIDNFVAVLDGGADQTFQAKGKVGVFGAVITQDATLPTSFSGNYTIDILDGDGDGRASGAEISEVRVDAILTGSGNANLDVRAALFPEFFDAPDSSRKFNLAVDADAVLTYSFDHANTMDLQFGNDIIGEFKNVRLDLGTFFEFVDSQVEKIQQALKPIKPVVDFLTFPIPVISDIGELVGLEKITPLDLGYLSALSPGLTTLQKDRILQGLTVTKAAVEFLDFLLEQGPISEGITGSTGLGSVKIGLNKKQGDTPEQDRKEREQLEKKPDPNAKEEVENETKKGGQFFAAVGGHLAFPFLEDTSLILNMLLGDTTPELMTFGIDFEFGYQYTIKVPIFPLLSAELRLDIGGTLNLDAGYDLFGASRFTDSLDFSSDSALQTSISENSHRLADGFFLDDHFPENPPAGLQDGDVDPTDPIFDIGSAHPEKEKPELTLTARISAGATVGPNLLIAELQAGVRVFFATDILFDLNDLPEPQSESDTDYVHALRSGLPTAVPAAPYTYDGRVRLGEMDLALNADPFGLFNISGALRAGLEAFLVLSVGFGPFQIVLVDETFQLINEVIFDFDIFQLSDAQVLAGQVLNPPAIGTVDAAGNLTLFMGNGPGGTASQRVNTGPNRQGNDTETSEGFSIMSLGATDPDDPSAGETLLVKFLVRDANGNWVERVQQTFEKVRNIHAVGGSGDDYIVVDDTVAASVDFSGGAGKDTLSYSGTGVAMLRGDDDDDILVGGSADDVLDGGAGNDNLSGGAGNDILLGGAGDDRLDGQDGADSYTGGTGSDTYVWNVGAGADTFKEDPGLPDDTDILTIGGGFSLTEGSYATGVDAVETDDVLSLSKVLDDGVFKVLVQTGAGESLLVDNIENLSITAGGGSDIVTVSDLSATDVNLLAIDLSSPAETNGGTSNDKVIFSGSSDADVLTVSGVSASFDQTDLGADPEGGETTQITREILELRDQTPGRDSRAFIINSTAARDSLEIRGLDGDDNLTVSAGTENIDVSDLIAVSLFGGAGNDTLTSAFGNVTLNGGEGNDAAHLHGDGKAIDGLASLSLYANDLFIERTQTGNGPVNDRMTFTEIEALRLELDSAGDGNDLRVVASFQGPLEIIDGAGDDQITIETIAGPTVLNLSSGSNTIRVGKNGSLAGIAGDLQIDGGDGTDHVIFDASASAVDLSPTVGVEQLSGLDAAGELRYDSLVETVELWLGIGNDTVVIPDLTRRIILDGGSGDDDAQATLLGHPTGLSDAPGVISANIETVDFINDDNTESTDWLIHGNQLRSGVPGVFDPLAPGFYEELVFDTGNATLVSLALSEGAGPDNVRVWDISRETRVDLRGGDDTVIIGDSSPGAGRGLADIAVPLVLDGGSGFNDLVIDDTANIISGHPGTVDANRISGFTMGSEGRIDYAGFGSLTLNLAATEDLVTVADTGTETILHTDPEGAGANDTVTVQNASAGVVIDLGAGSDNLTVLAGTNVIADGADMGGADTIVFDIRALTSPTSGGSFSGVDATGIVSGLGPISGVNFTGFEEARFYLGKGSDELTLDEEIPGLAVTVNADAGDDTVRVKSIGADTRIAGQSGIDAVVVVIPASPAAPIHSNLMTDLRVDVETLVVDNTGNATAVDWAVRSGILSGDGADLLFTDGAGEVRILGGSSSDTLAFEELSQPVDATIDRDKVILQLGDVVLASAGFGRFASFANVMDFDDFPGGGSQYAENQFLLQSTGTLVLDNTNGNAAAASAADDVFTLTEIDGNGFALHSVSLAAAGPGTQPVTFTGTTFKGTTVTASFDVEGGVGFQKFDLPSDFTLLASVEWTPGNTIVDNIVATSLIPSGGTAPEVMALPSFTTSLNIWFNTSTGRLASGDIFVDTDRDGITDQTITPGTVLTGNGVAGVIAQFIGNGVMQFRFAGDLIIPEGAAVTATGTNGLSLFAGNNVYIGTNVSFNLSAVGQTAGAGGGTGGTGGSNAGTAGIGGTDGGNGGAGGANDGSGALGGGSGTGTGAGGAGGGAGSDGGGTSGLSGSGVSAGGGGGGGGGQAGSGFTGSSTGGGGGAGGTGADAFTGGSGSLGSAGINSALGGIGGTGGAPGEGGTGGSGGARGGDGSGDGGAGGTGAAGSGGDAGTPGIGGVNTGSGSTISGGSGGGGGGAGGGGGRAGGGGGGGGGGGAYLFFGGGFGGDGGGGGGFGGAGASGALGGSGGGGGGAFEVVALGRVVVGSDALLAARGGLGGVPLIGLAGSPGDPGDAGLNANDNGGEGGNGGTGGTGGAGGASGAGAGGAGGTVKLYGTVVDAAGATIDVSGGVGAGNPLVRITSAGLLAQFYKPAGSVTNFPNFNSLTPVATRFDAAVFEGNGTGSFASAAGTDNFAARWTGQIEVVGDQTVTFTLGSDDGSRLYIDNVLVVNNGGVHGYTNVSTTTTLTAGLHDIRVEYFENGGFAGIALSFSIGAGPQRLLSVAPSGATGRFILGSNADRGAPAGFYNLTSLSGPTELNPFILGSPQTPLIADVAGGAEIFGLLRITDFAAFLTSVDAHLFAGEQLSQAPFDAVAAVIRLDVGPAGFADDYTGYDLILFINLSDLTLVNPLLGVSPGNATSRFETGLLTGGILTDPLFGGSGGFRALSRLGSHGVWAMLIPDTDASTPDSTSDYVTASVGGTVVHIEGMNLHDGQSLFIRAPRPELTSGAELAGLQAVAVSPDGAHVYGINSNEEVVVVANGGNLGQRQFFKDGIDGVDGLGGASAITVSPDGQNVYVTGSLDRMIATFARNATTGDLTFLGAVSESSGLAVFDTVTVSADGLKVFVGGADGVAVFSRMADGTLTQQAYADIGNVSDLAASPDGTLLYAVSASADTLAVADASSLAPLHSLDAVALGIGSASAVTVSGDNGFVYLAGDSGVLAVFERDFLTGNLTLVQTLHEGMGGIRGIAGANDAAISSDGLFVFVTGGTGRSLAVFARDAAFGTLQLEQVLRGREGLESPSAVTTGASGDVYVSSETGLGLANGGIARFRRAADTEPQVLVVSFDSIESLTLTTGPDDDVIRQINAADTESLVIDAGDGFNKIDLLNVGALTTVMTGVGDDSVSVRSAAPGASTVSILTGGGADSVSLREAAAGNAIVFDLGAGNDTIQIAGHKLAPDADVQVTGGLDFDTLQLDAAGNPILPLSPVNPDGTIKIDDPGFGTVIYTSIEDIPEFTPALVDAGGPYNIVEGGALALAGTAVPATGTTIVSALWDLNGDGVFGDATGLSPALSWQDLVAAGITDDGAYDITLQIIDSAGNTTTDTGLLQISNTAPALTVTAAPGTIVGQPYSIDFSAVDPGDDRIFRWEIHWGDGSSVDVFSSDATSATHIYATAGLFTPMVAASDEDGIYAAAAASVTVVPPAPVITTIGTAVNLQIREGDSVTLHATAAGTPSQFTWDLNGDGVFGDRTGANTVLTWAELIAFGIDDGFAQYPLSVRAIFGDGSGGPSVDTGNAVAQLSVLNAAPTATFSNSTASPGSPVPEGGAASVSFTGVADASPEDQATGFTYSYDFNNDGVFEIVGTPDATVAIPAEFIKDAGILVVRGLVIDKDLGSRQYFTDVRVVEVAPTLIITGANTSQEGVSYSLDLNATDPGNDTIAQWIVNWGDGSSETIHAATASLQHVFADNGLRTIAITSIDEDGLYTATRQVDVANVAPALSISGPDSIAEGDGFILELASSDPGDDTIATWRIDWGDGTTDTVRGSTSSVSHAYADDSGAGAYTVSATATDEDGAWTTNTQVTVTNVAPVAVLGSLGLALASAGGPFVVQEGGRFTLVIGGPFDPGKDTVVQYTIDWGDGSTPVLVDAPAPGKNGLVPALAVDHNFADGDALYEISVTLIDEDGAHPNNTTVAVAVDNVAPVIELDGSASTSEGTAYKLTLGSVFDPGADTVTSYIVHWGDGETSTYPAAGAVTHEYLNVSGSVQRAITVDLVDEDGTFLAAGRKALTVTEVAPFLALTGAESVTEGTPYTLTIGDLTDPGSGLGVIPVTQYTVDWGDGAVETLATGGAHTHTYLNGPFVYTITVDVVSNAGMIDNAGTLNVLVSNTPPVITSLQTNALVVGNVGADGVVLLSGTFSDFSTNDTHSAVIDWGDGTLELAGIVQNHGGGSISGSHDYLTGGIYKVSVMLSDQDGGMTAGATYALVTGARLVDGVLQIVGTRGADSVRLDVASKAGRPDMLVVDTSFLGDPRSRSTGDLFYQLSNVTAVVVLLGDGNDHFDSRHTLNLSSLISAGSGNDLIESTDGPSIVLGGSGNDIIRGGSGDDLLIGGDGSDIINGGDGKDILVGGDGNDHLHGDAGNDILFGGQGNDQISGDEGADVVLYSGNERDYDATLNIVGNGTVTDLHPSASRDDGTDQLKKIEHLLFGNAWSEAVSTVTANGNSAFDWETDPSTSLWFSTVLGWAQHGKKVADEDIVWIILE